MATPSTPPSWFERMLTKYMDDLQDFFWDAMLALRFNEISGDYVEFGSEGGKSLAAAYNATHLNDAPRRLWAFDSFEGLPEATSAHDEHPVWGQGGAVEGWRPGGLGQEAGLAAFYDIVSRFGVPRDSFEVVPGFFEDTLPAIGPDGPRATSPSPTSTATCTPAPSRCSTSSPPGSSTG